nr:hypothetical protein [Tanacetum cinerariifolium]
MESLVVITSMHCSFLSNICHILIVLSEDPLKRDTTFLTEEQWPRGALVQGPPTPNRSITTALSSTTPPPKFATGGTSCGASSSSALTPSKRKETLALSRQVEDAVEIAKKIKIPDLNKLSQPEDDDDAADA